MLQSAVLAADRLQDDDLSTNVRALECEARGEELPSLLTPQHHLSAGGMRAAGGKYARRDDSRPATWRVRGSARRPPTAGSASALPTCGSARPRAQPAGPQDALQMGQHRRRQLHERWLRQDPRFRVCCSTPTAASCTEYKITRPCIPEQQAQVRFVFNYHLVHQRISLRNQFLYLEDISFITGKESSLGVTHHRVGESTLHCGGQSLRRPLEPAAEQPARYENMLVADLYCMHAPRRQGSRRCGQWPSPWSGPGTGGRRSTPAASSPPAHCRSAAAPATAGPAPAKQCHICGVSTPCKRLAVTLSAASLLGARRSGTRRLAPAHATLTHATLKQIQD